MTTVIGAKMARTFYDVPEKQIHVVRDNDVIDLEGKTLKFIASMLHGPEVMFTYLVYAEILFCIWRGYQKAY